MKNAKKTISLLVAVIMIIAMLPISVFADTNASKKSKNAVLADNFTPEKLGGAYTLGKGEPTRGEAYILSGIPDNVEVYVNGVVQVPVDGTLKIEAGAEVVVKPSKGYKITSFYLERSNPEEYAIISMYPEDVYNDGTGYQLLIDSDCTGANDAYASLENGMLPADNAAIYAMFEYKIPENADGDPATENVLREEYGYAVVSGGTYDILLLNPDSYYGGVWFVNGYDDVEIENGYEYLFYLYYNGGMDIEVDVQTIGAEFTYDSEEGSVTFIMPADEVIMYCELEEVYEPEAPASIIWDFEEESDLEGWTFIDSDNDGFNWFWHYNGDTARYNTHSGEGILTSASYDNDSYTALFPDNWAITPAIVVPASGAELGFWYSGQDTSYYEENMAVYIGTSNTTDSMTKIGGDYIADHEYQVQYIDLSAYAGQTVYIGFRHYDISDMFFLNLDDVIIYGSDEAPADNINVIVPVVYGFSEGTEYSVSGNVVTVTYSKPCKVGYIPAGGTDYAAIAPEAVPGQANTYTFTAPAGVEEVLLVIKGDANLDKDITLADSTLTKSYFNRNVTHATMTPEEFFAGNVTDESTPTITLADSTAIKAVFNGAVTGRTFTWELSD